MPFQGRASMKLVTYDEVLKDSVTVDLRDRFADEIRCLETLGFSDEFYLRETAFPFSAIILLPIVFLMYWKGERVAIGSRLQVMAYNPYLIHQDGYGCSLISKLGMRYMTMFDDGTLLATMNYDNGSSSNPNYRFVCQNIPNADAEGAWRKHVQSVDSLSSERRTAIAPIGMKDVMRMENRYNHIIVGLMPDDLKDKRKNEG